MDADHDAAPDDIADLKEALATERAKGLEIAAELAVARTKASEDNALIAEQKLQIAKLRHQIYGQRSERSTRLIEQLALALEELEADATSRKATRRSHAQLDRYSQNERRRSVSLPSRCPCPHSGPPSSSAGRASALEMEYHVRTVAQPQAA